MGLPCGSWAAAPLCQQDRAYSLPRCLRLQEQLLLQRLLRKNLPPALECQKISEALPLLRTAGHALVKTLPL